MTKRQRASAKHYDDSYLLNVCGGGKEFIRGEVNHRFERAIRLAGVNKDDEVLDVGGGRGEIALLSSKIGAKVVVIDYSKAAIVLVNKYLMGSQNKRLVTTRVMNVKNLRFNNNRFDKIFFLEVLEHLTPAEVDIAIKEMLRVLKPGGKLIISTSPNKILINLLLTTVRVFKPNLDWKSRAYHINEQTYFSLSMTMGKLRLVYKIHCHQDQNFFMVK